MDKTLPKDYTFHNVSCDQATFGVYMLHKSKGLCPFCKQQFSSVYGAINKHLKSCKEKPQ